MTIPFDPNTMDAPVLPAPPPDLPPPPITRPDEVMPPPIVDLTKERLEAVAGYLQDTIQSLTSKHGELEQFYQEIEEAYRAQPIKDQGFPFKGHATETLPVVAATCEPIHARLDVGINKQDPPLRVRAINTGAVKFAKALENWVNFRRRNVLRMRDVSAPAYLELCKLGTCVAKTAYVTESRRTKGYELAKDGSWEVVDKTRETQRAKVTFPSAADVIWPAGYTDSRTLPIIVERQQWTLDELIVASDGDMPAFDKDAVQSLLSHANVERTLVDSKRDEMNKDRPTFWIVDQRVELFEAWFWYDAERDPNDRESERQPPQHFVATIHLPTMTLLQLRYNPYFHQRHPYTIIPYTVVNGTLRGLGAGEMAKPFQDAETKWYRMASDNAYLANIRMWATPKGLLKEQRIEMFAGRNLNAFADPFKEIRELKMSDTYPSTLNERSYLDQLRQLRTGANDYMSGSESPVVGSRATATSTLALIAEGKSRVEEVLENVRQGEADIHMMCLSFDIQFGPGRELDAAMDPEDAALLHEFFDSTHVEDLEGAIAIELSATDAGGNRNVQQQNLMAVQQILDGYTQMLMQFMQMGAQNPQLIPLLLDAADAKRQLLRDLLAKYDVRDADTILPDLHDYLAVPPAGPPAGPPGPQPPGSPAGAGTPPGNAGQPGLPGPVAAGAGAMEAAGLPPTGIGGIDRTTQHLAGAMAGLR